jgi:hypothetical protein
MWPVPSVEHFYIISCPFRSRASRGHRIVNHFERKAHMEKASMDEKQQNNDPISEPLKKVDLSPDTSSVMNLDNENVPKIHHIQLGEKEVPDSEPLKPSE